MTSTSTRSAAAQYCSAKRLTRHTEKVDIADDGLSQRSRSYGSDRNDPRRDARDELTKRVNEESLEMRLEMSQKSELTTGARGCDARSRRTGREDSTDSADHSISKVRNSSSGHMRRERAERRLTS